MDDPDSFWAGKRVSDSSDQSTPLLIQDLNSSEIVCSPETDLELATFHSAKERLFARGQKLQGLEVFGGAGGLSLRLQMSAAVHTKDIVEFAPAAAAAAETNIPWLTAHNEDINSFLGRAFEREAGCNDYSEMTDTAGNPVKPCPILEKSILWMETSPVRITVAETGTRRLMILRIPSS